MVKDLSEKEEKAIIVIKDKGSPSRIKVKSSNMPVKIEERKSGGA